MSKCLIAVQNFDHLLTKYSQNSVIVKTLFSKRLWSRVKWLGRDVSQAGDEFMITCLLHYLLTHHNIIQYNARHRSVKSESVYAK